MDYTIERERITFPPHVNLHEGDEYIVRKQEGCFALVPKEELSKQRVLTEADYAAFIGSGRKHITNAQQLIDFVNQSRDEWDDE